MSIYPKPLNETNYFNPDDYITENEVNENNDISINHDIYLKKIGGTMTGNLNVPKIVFNSDNTEQETAFTSTIKTDINNNKEKTNLITIEGDAMVIDKLKVKNILFVDDAYSTTPQINNFTNANRLQINTNTTAISNIQNKILGVNYINESLYLNSDLTTNNNLIHTDSYGIKLNRNGNYIGKIGATEETDDNFYIISNDKNIVLDSQSKPVIISSDTLKIGEDFRSSKIELNGESQYYAFTDTDKNKLEVINFFGAETQIITKNKIMKLDPGTAHMSLYSNNIYFGNSSGTNLHINGQIQNNAFIDSYIVDIITARDKLQEITVNEYDFTFDKNVIIKSPNTLTINDEIQTSAFTNSLKDKLETINNVIFEVSEVQTKQTHQTRYQNPSNNLEGVGYIGSNSTGSFMTIVTYNDKPLVFHSDSYVDNWTPDMYIGRNTEPGRIHIRSGSTGDGGRIYLNGETQQHAFTNDDHEQLATNTSNIALNTANISSLMLSKIFVRINAGWAILDRGPFLYDEYVNTDAFYNILKKTAMVSYVNYITTTKPVWNAGNKRIRVKYSINCRVIKSSVKKLKSRIMQYTTDSSISLEEYKYNSLFAGVDNHYFIDNYEWINYSDDVILDMVNGDTLYIFTDYDIDCSLVSNFEMNSVIEIVEM